VTVILRGMGRTIFDLDQFVADCRAALAEDQSFAAVRDVVARAVRQPSAVMKAIGEPTWGQIQTLHHSPDLTVLNVIWAPKMTIFPHNHTMAAVIGIYSGREDNLFWRRLADESHRVEAAGAKALSEKDAVLLGPEIIHSVTNPIGRYTGAIHVYRGDFFAAGRSQWDPESLCERPYDAQCVLQIFEDENRHLLTARRSPALKYSQT
jgi:predicted metal-dependent enzyme (double-stranded beta helix superfamily)